MNLIEIQQLTETFANAYDNLIAVGAALESEIADLRREYEKTILGVADELAEARAALASALKANPHLFTKPKTRVFGNIKVGYGKHKGKILIADEADTIERLTALLGEKKAAPFLHVKVTVNKTAVGDLPMDIAKQAGIEITDAADAIIIKPMKGEISQLIESLLADRVPGRSFQAKDGGSRREEALTNQEAA